MEWWQEIEKAIDKMSNSDIAIIHNVLISDLPHDTCIGCGTAINRGMFEKLCVKCS